MTRMPRLRFALLALLSALAIAACGSDDGSGGSTVTETTTVETTPSSETTETTTSTPDTTSTTSTTSTTTTDEPNAGLQASESVIGGGELSFTSPSGNISCLISTREVRCDILEASFEPPPKPSDCDFDWGPSVVVAEQGQAGFICVSDAVPQGSTLEYGTYVNSLGFTCSSTEDGIDCNSDRSGGGFVLSRERFELE